jgi:hypothetical protein
MPVVLAKYAAAAVFDSIPLTTYGSGERKLVPTLATGDVKVSKDGGATANIGTLPTEQPASSGTVRVTVTASELTAKSTAVLFHDQAGTQWEDTEVLIHTYGHASAMHPDFPADAIRISNSTTAANTVEANIGNLDAAVSAVKAKTDNLPSDPADQSLVIAATDALAALIGTVDAVVDAIKAVTDNLPNSGALNDLASILEDTVDIQSRLPAALVGGRMDGSVGDIVAAALAQFFTQASGETYATSVAQSVVKEIADNAAGGGGGGSNPTVLQNTTIATLASQTNFTLTAGSADDGAYEGCLCIVEDASTSTQKAVGVVGSYTGASRTLMLLNDPGVFTMAVGDTVDIIADRSVHPTIDNRTLDVAATGEAGVDLDNTVGTLSAAQIAANAIGASELATDAVNKIRDAILSDATAFAGADVGDVKAKTNNLPSDPADQSLIIAATDTLATLIGAVDTIVDAIKAVTDNLPNSGALNDLAGILADTVNIKTRLPAALVGGRMDGSVGDILAVALAKLFSVASGETYATAVAQSVVKEIADNAAGGGGGTIVLGPLVASVDLANRLATPIAFEMFQHAEKEFVITVLDANGDPVDLSAMTLRFIVYDANDPPNTMFQMEDEDITISGANNEIARVTVTATESATAADGLWILWDVPTDTALARGSFAIRAAAQ